MQQLVRVLQLRMCHLSVISQTKIPQEELTVLPLLKKEWICYRKEERIETVNYVGSLITLRHPYYVTYYYDNNGNKLMGWQDINGERYYFKKSENILFETIDGNSITLQIVHVCSMMNLLKKMVKLTI